MDGKMDFASHEDEVMDEKTNDQYEEMSDQEMSDEDHALSNDSCLAVTWRTMMIQLK